MSLIASLEVALGTVVPSLGPTRTEADFLNHIKSVIDQDPEGGWIFILSTAPGSIRLKCGFLF